MVFCLNIHSCKSLGCLLILALLVHVEPVHADDHEAFNKVAHIFERRCISCHNDADTKGGLSLTSAKAFLKGGDSGTIVEPGKADRSLLIDYIIGDKPLMPRAGKPLLEEEVSTIRKWIQSGAAWPKGGNLPRWIRSMDEIAVRFSSVW